MRNKKITCRENSKYYINNRALLCPWKALDTWTTGHAGDVSKSRSSCLPVAFCNKEGELRAQASQLHNPTQPLAAPLRGDFYALSSIGNLSASSAFSAHLAATPTLWSPPGGVGTREARREGSLPNLFKTWDNLHATALSWMKSHQTAWQPGNGLPFTNLKL